MERWGYITVDAPLIRPTSKGRRAQETWRPLFEVIAKRWRERFGEDEIETLRDSLSGLVSQFDIELPEYLPVVGYGLFARVLGSEGKASDAPANVSLPSLLSKVLLAFTLVFERDFSVSLAIAANVMRLLSEDGVRVRDLPRLSGVSKEAIKMSLGFLEKLRYIVIGPAGHGSTMKLIRLTAEGRKVQDAHRRRLVVIEERWRKRFGEEALRNLRETLERLVGEPAASPLFAGIEPYPGGWRASVRKPETLPHHPMVLHRGGYPDGS